MRDKIIKVAEGEIGVCEPSGDDKYITYWNKVGGTKFALTVAWCAIFVTWCKAMAGIGTSIIPNFASCDIGKQWFEKKKQYKLSKAFGGTYTPVKGDIIFFSSKKTQADSTHVGIVTGVSGTKVNTIEGNTSNKVARRSYDLGNKTILGYGVPAYTGSTGESIEVTVGKPVSVTLTMLKKGCKGGEVKTLQRLLIGAGYSCGSAGIDGDFGSGTYSALKKYQSEHRLTVDGICGKNTWEALLKNE